MRFIFTAPVYHTNQHFAVKALIEAGHEVSFLALRSEHSHVYDALHPTVLGESIATRALNGERTSVPPLTRFWTLMRSLKPDVVVVRNPNYAYGLLTAVVGRMIGANVIFYSLTPMHRRLKWWKVFMRSIPAWAAGAKWMTPILGSPEQYPPTFGALRYIPFAMEPQTAPEQRHWFRDGAINVLSVGKYQERKNHRLFLQVIANLSKKYQVRATIIGECTTADHWREFAEVKNLGESLGLNHSVRLKANMAFWDVQREYATHDVFVLPSRDEPAGISLLEAMSHSMPVVCSESCGLKACVQPGENGYVFITDDADHLEECMERIIRDRTRLMEMGARSYETVLSEHSPARYVENLESIAQRNC